MDLLLMGFTTYTNLVQRFKMPVSSFFQLLEKIKAFVSGTLGPFIPLFPTVKDLYSSDLVQSFCLFSSFSKSEDHHILFDTASWSKLSLSAPSWPRFHPQRMLQYLAWLLALVQSLLIIASRKHYTVDIVVAWYTVNLVIFYVDNNLPEMAERSSGPSQTPLLPLSTKDGKSKSRDDKRLLNVNNIVSDQ